MNINFIFIYLKKIYIKTNQKLKCEYSNYSIYTYRIIKFILFYIKNQQITKPNLKLKPKPKPKHYMYSM